MNFFLKSETHNDRAYIIMLSASVSTLTLPRVGHLSHPYHEGLLPNEVPNSEGQEVLLEFSNSCFTFGFAILILTAPIWF